MKKFDLVGKQYGYLTVIAATDERYKCGGDTIWKCRCVCGKDVFFPTRALRAKRCPKSCGCKTKELQQKNGSDIAIKHDIGRATMFKGTKVNIIRNFDKPYKNSKTGIKGVCFDKQRGKYKATINVSGKQINIGRFSTLSEAKKAREAAVDRVYIPIIKEFDENDERDEHLSAHERSYERNKQSGKEPVGRHRKKRIQGGRRG